MKRKRSGFTLVEVIVSMALLGIISVSLIGGFPSQLMNIVRGKDITVQALEEQSSFEEIIYNVKTMIKDHNPAESLDSLVSTVPEWSYETVEVLGENIVMQKLNKSYADVAKDNTIYLSRKLAEKEKVNKLSLTNVMIDVSTDPSNLVADLSLSPLPTLKAVHDDNTGDTDFYVNLYKWWKSSPGKDLASLVFPDDFTMISVSQTTDILTNLLDNVGAGRFVALTVTPVDINGHRGNAMLSSNYVFVKGAEWRVGPFPWADTNNDYNFDANDVRISTDRIKDPLNSEVDLIPKYNSPLEQLSIEDSSLFVPMNVEPVGGSIPGDVAVQISDSEVINWSFENNINIAKDFQVLNNSNVNVTAGTDGNGGGIYLYPYIQLDGSGNPVIVGGFPVIINHGASISTDGNINLKTLSRGDIELLNHNELDGNNINLEARGSVQISNSTLNVNNDIVLNTNKNLEIAGDRSIELDSAVFSSSNSDSKIRLEAEGNILCRGGGWSSNQTIYIPNGKYIAFSKAADNTKVSNSGIIDVGNTGRMYFVNSMNEDLERSFRIRLEKDSDDSFELTTINYKRNISYASPSSNQQVVLPNIWTRLGSNNQNFEFSTRVVSGPGDVKDLKYSFENGIITINVATTQQRDDTKIKFDVRDSYNNEIVGSGYFVFSVDNSGNPTIEVEEPPPLNYYTITLNTNGGSEIPPIRGYAGEIVTVPNPTKIGYNFLGWDKAVPTVIPDYDLQLNALWEPIVYEISFDSNGGHTINSLYYRYGEEISIPNPTRVGYTFYGWNETPPDTMPAHDLHYVAQWTNKLVTVVFNANGGTAPSPATRGVYYGLEYGELADTTRSGYVFQGWFTAAVGGTEIRQDTKVTNDNNHTLFAHWASNTYTVTFDSNGGGPPNPGTMPVTYGSTYGSLATVSRSGYNFDGWFTDQSSGYRITENSKVDIVGDHRLYARWNKSGGSCPFIYSFDGADYHFEHESIPFAISKALETTSYGTLRKLELVDGIYKARIAENLDEKSFINGFSLYVVDYPKDSDVEYVKVDIFGDPHTISDKQYPLSIDEKVTGKDVLYEVTTGGVLAGTDFGQMESKDFMTNYELEFKKPSSEAELGKFMITVQKSYFTTILGEYYLDKVNAKTDFWLLEKLLGLPLIENQFKDFMKVITLNVDVWDGNKWIEQGNIKAGRDLMEEFLVPIDLTLIDQNTDKVIIRLSHGAGLFEIESVSMDYSINQINKVRELKISSALFNEMTDVYSDLKNHHDNKRTKMVKGDIIDLEFVAPELDKNMNRGYYVSLTGYYYMDPDIREVSDILETGDKSTFSNIKTILDSIKSMYEDNRTSIKWLFGLIKDSFNKPLDYKVELIIKGQYNEILEYIKNKK